MNIFNESLNKYQLFTCFGLFFIGLGYLGILLSLLGIFFPVFIIFYVIVGSGILFYLIIKNRTNIEISLTFFIVLILSLAYITLLAFYTTPTIFSGRDQGSFAEAAVRLSQNHQLEFTFPAALEFSRIYGHGEALNFPGFHYNPSGNLISQFPLGYTSWLAIFYSLFGLSGFVIANGITFLIFLICFYLIAKLFLKPSSTIIAFLIIITSFIFSWFFKFTLSENIALALTWFGVLTFLLFLKEQSQMYLLSSILSFSLLAFSRLEALTFLAMIFIIFLVKFFDPDYRLSSFIGKKTIMAISAIILLYFINIYINFGYFYMVAKGLIHSLEGANNNGINPLTTIIYNIKVFSAYSLIIYIVLGISSIIYLIAKHKWNYLVPFAILLPSLFYLINPSISIDHPWMLRRYVYALIPLFIFYSVWFLDHFLEKKYLLYLSSFLLLLSNVYISLSYFNISENRDLLAQVTDLSQNFKKNDLILVDREASGNGFAMITGPMQFLYGKQAVYFFNPSDLEKIDKNKFDNIYLIIPDDNTDFYLNSGLGNKLSIYRNYTIKNQMLPIRTGEKPEIYASPVELPLLENITVYGKIYKLVTE